MSNAFSELIERATAGEGLNREEIHTLLVDGEGQDFALIEAASVVRRNEFRNMIAIHTEDEALADALGTRSIAVDSYEVLDISRDIDSEELAATIERIAESSAIGVTVLLPENAVPMMLMRVLSILRLAAPAKVIHLPEGYEQSLRSLTSLAMHVVSAITITDDIEQWPMVNEVLRHCVTAASSSPAPVDATPSRVTCATSPTSAWTSWVTVMHAAPPAARSMVAAVAVVRVAAAATKSRHLPPVVAAAARADAVPPLKLRLSLTATPTVTAVAAAATTSPRKKRVAAAVATTSRRKKKVAAAVATMSPSRSWRKLPQVVAAVVLAVAAPSSPLG